MRILAWFRASRTGLSGGRVQLRQFFGSATSPDFARCGEQPGTIFGLGPDPAPLKPPFFALPEARVLCNFGEEPSRGPSDYELSLGRVTDTLAADYPAFFERDPDWAVYASGVTLEVGSPWDMPLIRGHTAYRRGLQTLRRLAGGAIRGDRTVGFRVEDGRGRGHDLRVSWTVRGELLGVHRDVRISGISFYTLAPEAGNDALSHPILRHAIEIVEVHPPSLLDALPALRQGLEPRGCPA